MKVGKVRFTKEAFNHLINNPYMNCLLKTIERIWRIDYLPDEDGYEVLLECENFDYLSALDRIPHYVLTINTESERVFEWSKQ
jgi:hypothetical protein